MAKVKVGINGFGRIGRQALKNYLDTRRVMLEVALGRKAAAFWAKVKELLG